MNDTFGSKDQKQMSPCFVIVQDGLVSNVEIMHLIPRLRLKLPPSVKTQVSNLFIPEFDVEQAK
jgi:hypothetical protein